MPEEPSIKEANKTLRVLKGEKLKFTVTIYRKDDMVEYQSNDIPVVKYSDETRGLIITDGDYNGKFVCCIDERDVVHTEENPK